MLSLLKENAVVLGAAATVLVALGATVKVTLPADEVQDAKIQAVSEILDTHIVQNNYSRLADDMERIRLQIKGVERDLRIANEQGWPPHDISDLKELLRLLREQQQQILDSMRKQQG